MQLNVSSIYQKWRRNNTTKKFSEEHTAVSVEQNTLIVNGPIEKVKKLEKTTL